MPELESSKHCFPLWKHYRKKKREDLFREEENIFFDMCVLAWLQELRNQHSLATCWPKLANNKVEKEKKNIPPAPGPPQVEIFLVFEHQEQHENGDISPAQEYWKQISKG